MKKMQRKSLGISFIALIATLVVSYYQACTPTNFSPIQNLAPSLALNGNGDSYSGKLSYFNSVDTTNPCLRLSNQGRAFPRQQIFVVNGAFSLVRDNCQDIAPVRLDSNLIQMDPNGETMIYQGQSYALHTDFSEFDQVPVVCPVGKSIDMPMGNLFSSSLNLTDSAWRKHPEIPAQPGGSLEALPKFRIEVANPNLLEDWRRVSQDAVLTPNTQYVTTFLLQAGSVDFASISYNEQPAGQFVVVVDLLNASAYVQFQAGAANPVITSVARYGNAVAVSVAFTSSSSMNGSGGDIGVAPYRPGNNDKYAVGDSVFATAAHLNLCR